MEVATQPKLHDFKMHPELLRSVIRKQAGSLDKALLEGVMNSIDANATRVDITIDPLRVTVKDDGRGFRDANEIREFFATFGTPHAEGDAVYGRFRMGRGQMFAFGINEWRTGEFKMDVDINKHLGFELDIDLPVHNGCDILIKLYDPLSEADIHNTIRSISKMVKYTSIPVYINGEKVNVDIDVNKFPQTIDEAYINTVSAQYGGLDVYNLGVLVCSMPAWKFGVSGVVISRKQLDVNFARNEVLGTCKVWRTIKKVVDASGKKSVQRKTSLTRGEQENIILRLIVGDLLINEVDTVRFLRDITGKVWSPSQIRRAQFESYCVADYGNQYGDKLIQTGKAIVFDQLCIELFECKPEELFNKYQFYKMPSYATMESLTEGIASTGTVIPKTKWKPTEKAWEVVARRMQYYLHCQYYHGCGKPKRQMKIGVSQVANGWTDGKNYVAFAREFLSQQKMFVRGRPSTKSFTNVAMLLIHEMCHDIDSRDNVHTPDFYREYHDITRSVLGLMVSDSINYMTPVRYKIATKEDILDDEIEPESESIE